MRGVGRVSDLFLGREEPSASSPSMMVVVWYKYIETTNVYRWSLVDASPSLPATGEGAVMHVNKADTLGRSPRRPIDLYWRWGR